MVSIFNSLFQSKSFINRTLNDHKSVEKIGQTNRKRRDKLDTYSASWYWRSSICLVKFSYLVSFLIDLLPLLKLVFLIGDLRTVRVVSILDLEDLNGGLVANLSLTFRVTIGDAVRSNEHREWRESFDSLTKFSAHKSHSNLVNKKETLMKCHSCRIRAYTGLPDFCLQRAS